jgi:hypothetical protein
MGVEIRQMFALVAMATVSAASIGIAATSQAPAVVSMLDLSGPFATRTAWRFVATQGPQVADAFGSIGDKVPGLIDLCLRKAATTACDPVIEGRQPTGESSHSEFYAESHYLNEARIVYPRGLGAPPLLIVQAASVHSGDGDQLVSTQVLAYRAEQDRFARIYERVTGRNNNQDVRYVDKGPLQGDIISVEPTQNAPFGFWVTVSRLTPDYTYRQVLRYRSATRYGDGNPLAVVDSETPNILQRLGLWRSGSPLPIPDASCPRPHLIRSELWCS